MNHDQTFRAVLIVVVLLVLPIGIYHRLKSQATREKLDRRQEGLFILATLRPVGIAELQRTGVAPNTRTGAKATRAWRNVYVRVLSELEPN